MKYYAVFDTNVLVSSLLTKKRDSATAKVVDAVASGSIIPLYSQDILDEYDNVLRRKKFSFSEERILRLLKMFRQYGIEVIPGPTGEIFKDMDDIVFYEVVMEKREEGRGCLFDYRKYPPFS